MSKNTNKAINTKTPLKRITPLAGHQLLQDHSHKQHCCPYNYRANFIERYICHLGKRTLRFALKARRIYTNPKCFEDKYYDFRLACSMKVLLRRNALSGNIYYTQIVLNPWRWKSCWESAHSEIVMCFVTFNFRNFLLFVCLSHSFLACGASYTRTHSTTQFSSGRSDLNVPRRISSTRWTNTFHIYLFILAQ